MTVILGAGLFIYSPPHVWLAELAVAVGMLGIGLLTVIITMWQVDRLSQSYDDAYLATCDRFIQQVLESKG
jgi:hypothetical protein